MKRAPEKDPYTVLGVNRYATQVEIRAAYISRTRVVHPDRFDRARQAREWALANDMLKELNQAYEILSNPNHRAMYDSFMEGKDSARRAPPPPSSPPPPPPPEPEPERTSPYTGAQEEFVQNDEEHPPFYRTPLFYLLGFSGMGLGSAIGSARVTANPTNPEMVSAAFMILSIAGCGLMGYVLSRGIDGLIQRGTGRLIGKIVFGVLAIYAFSGLEERIRKAYGSTQTATNQPIATIPVSEIALPASGELRSFTGQERIAPLEIRAAQGSHYFVKLVDTSTQTAVLTLFVRGGNTEKVDVPLGTYELRYASGEKWYGYEQLFGKDTSYSKADNTFRFHVDNDSVNGYTVTLYRVANGNLRTSRIGRAEF
jgi:hypothetical protein